LKNNLLPSIRDASESVSKVALGLMGTVAVIACVSLLFASASGNTLQDLTRIGIAASTLGGCAVAYVLGSRGQLRLGLALAFFSMYASITAHAVLAKFGIHAYLVGSLSMVIFGCYMLIGRMAGHTAAVIAFVTIFALYTAGEAGAFGTRERWPIPARNVLIVYTILYALATVTGLRYSEYFSMAMRELEKQSQHFRTAFLALPYGCMISADGRVVLANEIYKKHMGIDLASELAGTPMLDIALPENREKLKTRLAAAAKLKPNDFLPIDQVSIRGPSGTKTIQLSTRSIELASGAALLTVTTDVTEQIGTLEALAREREKAVAASQAKGTFLATMSHEIRTPLNAVIGLTALMRTEILDDETRARYLGLVADSSQTLLQLLNNVLDISRIESGKLELNSEPVDIRALCKMIGHTYTALAAAKSIIFDVRTAEDVPQFILGDSLRLKQVVGNLISNAIKFTHEGSVALRAGAIGDKVEIIVEDTGIGISEETRLRLFHPFAQADSNTTREYGGSGLGLALCRELVLLMGGTIDVESEPGRGSRFRILLPAASLRGSSQTNAEALATPLPSARRPSVWVIEDDELNALVIQAMLSASRAAPEIFADASVAIERCQSSMPPDMVLLDVCTSATNGFDFVQRARALDCMKNVPLIAYTSAPINKNDARLAAAGFSDLLCKPCTQGEVTSVLARWLKEPLDQANPGLLAQVEKHKKAVGERGQHEHKTSHRSAGGQPG
jgi:signal transduction histidine kinase/FixJ family two-component response regulator